MQNFIFHCKENNKSVTSVASAGENLLAAHTHTTLLLEIIWISIGRQCFALHYYEPHETECIWARATFPIMQIRYGCTTATTHHDTSYNPGSRIKALRHLHIKTVRLWNFKTHNVALKHNKPESTKSSIVVITKENNNSNKRLNLGLDIMKQHLHILI